MFGLTSHSQIMIIVGLLLAFLAFGAGKGLGPVLRPAFRKFFGSEGGNGGEPERFCSTFNPATCPDHKAEHERSLRNEANIKELWAEFTRISQKITDGLAELQKTHAEGIAALHQNQLKLLLGLVQGGVLDPKFVPEGIAITPRKATKEE